MEIVRFLSNTIELRMICKGYIEYLKLQINKKILFVIF